MNIDLRYDPYDQEIRRNPYPYYSHLRDTCPVNHHVLDSTHRQEIAVNPMMAEPTDEFWQVFSYQHAVEVLQDPETFSSRQGPGPERAVAPNEVGMLIYADPPHHARHRRIVVQALSPRIVNAMEPRIRQIAEEMVDSFAADGEADIVGRFTVHLPAIVFSEVLGVPREDAETFERWAQALVDAFGGDPSLLEASVASITEMTQYFLAIRAERLAALERGEALPDDLLTAIITSEYEGRTFDETEFMLVVPILVGGGNETSASALANGLYELCRRPDQLAKLYADRSLIPMACEEIVRYQSTPQCLFRSTTRATEIAGVPVPANAKIGVVFGAANRDESVFDRADEFDISRDPKELRRHLGFGRGIHSCVGASLGRMIMRVGLETILDRLPDLRIDERYEPTQHTSFMARTWSSLHLKWTPPRT